LAVVARYRQITPNQPVASVLPSSRPEEAAMQFEDLAEREIPLAESHLTQRLFG
jgi:hypothetical protein